MHHHLGGEASLLDPPQCRGKLTRRRVDLNHPGTLPGSLDSEPASPRTGAHDDIAGCRRLAAFNVGS